MIAGEDPELSYRVRGAGWGIHRLAEEMTIHDAQMRTFRQWWVRATRAGHAYADCFAMHRRDGLGFCRRELVSILVYGALAPSGMLIAAALVGSWSWAGLAIYPILWGRVIGHRMRHGDGAQYAMLYASACVMAKFAQVMGALRHGLSRGRGVQVTLIEYKTPGRHSDKTEAR